MGEFYRSAGTIFSNYGILIASVAALLTYLSEVYAAARHTGPRTGWANAKMVVRLIVTMISVGAAVLLLSVQYEKKPAAAQAADNVIETYHTCLSATANLPDRARVEADGYALPLECLAYAIQVEGPRSVATTAPVALSEDVELGERLLGDGAATDKISETLRRYFGVYADTFLGTGYSLPGAGAQGNHHYSSAGIREYLTQNYCAKTAPPLCEQRKDRVWGWMIDPSKLGEDTTVREIITGQPPTEGADSFNAFWAGREYVSTDDDPVLVRFSTFKPEYYKGTVGRAEAVYVFFSELDQVLDVPVRRALVLSGSNTKDIDERKPGEQFFIWVVGRGGTTAYKRLATWQNVIDLLKRIEVDRSVVNAMAAIPKPLLRRLQEHSGS